MSSRVWSTQQACGCDHVSCHGRRHAGKQQDFMQKRTHSRLPCAETPPLRSPRARYHLGKKVAAFGSSHQYNPVRARRGLAIKLIEWREDAR